MNKNKFAKRGTKKVGPAPSQKQFGKPWRGANTTGFSSSNRNNRSFKSN